MAKKKLVKEVKKECNIGVIVGRFQVPFIHEGHRRLIEHVIKVSHKVIIVLGNSRVPISLNNPLSFEMRKDMILSKFPQVTVLFINDEESDYVWSVKLDQMIMDIRLPADKETILFGGRDSFINHYHGDFKTRSVEITYSISGTELRERAKNMIKNANDFRAGVIWATSNQYKNPLPTVDAIIKDYSSGVEKFLLVKKANEAKWRFCGGFADVNGSYEEDILREINEELHIKVKNLRYVGSCKVDDWRYRNEPNGIKTVIYECEYDSQPIFADDDIAEAKFFYFNEVMDALMNGHKRLWEIYLEYLKNTEVESGFRKI